MADRRRIVTISPTGTVTTVKDLEDSTSYFSVRDSFEIAPSSRKTVYAQRTRRYGGSQAASESHENATVKWKILVSGTTADNVNANVESALSVLERATLDTFLEWRPDGAGTSTYFEIRGPGSWQLTYQWVQYQGTKTMVVDVSLPVAPLARGDVTDAAPVQSQTFTSTTMPATVQLGTAIPGSASAQVDVKVRASGGSNAPIWALVGWTKRPGTPLTGSVAPFGAVEAEAYNTVTTWAAIGTDTNFRGSNGIRTTTSGAGTASALWTVDPSVMQPDDFTRSTIDVEVWARVELASGVVSPKLTLSLEPNAGSSFGASQYSAEYGSAGKLLTSPSSGTRFRFVRLGTLTMPVDTATPLKWDVKIAASWATASSGSFGLDYLCMVPARSRAVSKSGVANDSGYPKFISSTSDTTKTVRWDLSGQVASGTGNPGTDSGLGGVPVEMPVGNVDVFVKLSSLVADDPTSDTTSEQKEHTGVTGEFLVSPRYWVAR